MMKRWSMYSAIMAAIILSLVGSKVSLAADDAAGIRKQLLELTGGKRVKVAWNQGSENDMKLKFLDTQDEEIRELPLAGSAPLLTINGGRVFVSAGKASDRSVLMYDTQSRKTTTLATGLGNNLLAVWTDPKTHRDWVYVNDCGDKNEPWNVAAGKIYRFAADKPAERELFWDRTSSHIYLMFAADGTRACFEPSWSNIGQLKLAFDAQGKVDQDNCTYKTFGGGCFPSMAPDNSYRIFRLDGDHRSVTICDADNANQRHIKVDGMLTTADPKGTTWLTRWSTHPRYMTLIAPSGKEAALWMGRFDEKFTKIEAWARVTLPGPQCWQSQAWVDSKE